MRKKIIFILLILVVILPIIGCVKEVSLVETKEEYFTMYTNENISIKISNTVKDNEDIYSIVLEDLQKIDEFSPIHNIEIDIDEKYIIPKIEDIIKCNSNFVETKEFKKELIKKSYDIYDNWISEGLYAKIYDIEEKEVDFTTYYLNNEFSLFGARFFEPFSSKKEIENVQAASIDLVEYLIKKGKKEELLKNQIDISDVEEWAKDKNIDFSYQRSIESLMNRMEVNKIKPNIFLTINTKENINGFIIDIQTMDEQYDTAEKIEEFILMMDINIKNIKEGIKEDAPNFYNDYSDVIENVPKIYYYFNMNEQTNRAEPGQGKIRLRDLQTQAHEFNHILMADPFLQNDIKIDNPKWLDEGIANYLDIVYSDSFILEIKRRHHIISNVKANEHKFNEESKKLVNSQIEIFERNNINLSNPDKIMENKDERIKISTILGSMGIKFSKSITAEGLIEDTVYVSGGESRPDQKLWPMDRGNYINYYANFSFVNYLIEEYGVEKLLYLKVEDFSTLTYEEYFQKSYEELKVDWIEYLKENIKAIELIL
ncbi:hypothetical protein [uncultured Tissierella sp.]|uniref:hypothetical protein n=1 Tax=uncultured Tissierella sp. TaxID=448160 RepID=UPI00280641D2|nr:hypothetical protein [uncultured Tissierella sp.]MDU5082774.1 hypothetical protein [Bacillota bacterium]